MQNGLAVLVQQGLVYHNLEADTKTTFYEANDDAAYGLVRSGKILEAVESRLGVTAKDVVQNVLLLGHTKVSDFEKVYESKANGHINGNGRANGVSENGQTPTISVGQLHSVLGRLLEARVIQPVVKTMFRSPQDTFDMVERELLKNNYGGATKGKQRDELNNQIRHQMNTIRSEGQDWRPKGNKRPLHGANSNGANKRRRLSISGTSVNSYEEEDDGTRLNVSSAVPHSCNSADITYSPIWSCASITRSVWLCFETNDLWPLHTNALARQLHRYMLQHSISWRRKSRGVD